MLISDEYRETNRWMLANKNYGVSGHLWSERVDRFVRGMKAASLLDYGCGRGYLVQNLPADREYKTLEYDPGVSGKECIGEWVDIVACTDVLEHIEPDCLDDVLNHIFALARRGVFLVVATEEAAKHLPDGRNAHLIVEDSDWWLPKLLSRWMLIEFFAYANGFVFVGMPRCKPH